MSFLRIKDIQRDLCKDFCDLSGKTGNYTKAWIIAIVLDIIIPIGLFFIGIGATLLGFLLEFFLPMLGGWIAGGIGLVLFLITLGAVIVLMFLEFREIGLFVLIPIGANGIIIILGIIPFLGIIAFILSLVLWNVVAVLSHIVIYKEGKIFQTILGE